MKESLKMSELKISARHSYLVPKERISPAFASRISRSPAGEYRGLGLDVKSREVNTKDRTVLFTASTESVDRMGDVIVQSGWDLANYRKNPVGLFAHDSNSLPIAKGLQTEVQNGQLYWLAQFATKEAYPFADTVFQLIVGGFLNAASVGFIPLAFEYGEPNEGDIFPPIRFTATELLEISVVPIPANPEALAVGRSIGTSISELSPLDEFIEMFKMAAAAENRPLGVDELIRICRPGIQ